MTDADLIRQARQWPWNVKEGAGELLRALAARLEDVRQELAQAQSDRQREHDLRVRLQGEAETLRAQRDTAYGYGRDGGEPPWMK